MNTQNIDLTKSQFIYANLDQLTAQAKQARAIAIRELAVDAIAGLGKIFSKLAAWNNRRVATAELMNLDDRLLADIGIGRSEIQSAISSRMMQGAANRNAHDRDAA